MMSGLNDELPTTICDHFRCLYGVTESYDSTNQSFWGDDNIMVTYSLRRDISEGEF